MSINVYTGHGSKWADVTTEMKQIKVFILMTDSLRIKIYNDTGSLNDNAYPRDANGLPVNMWVSNILWEVEKFAKNSSQQDKANQISKVVVDDFNFASQA